MATPTARRLTDEQLRTAQLVVSNPLEMAGLTADPPDKSRAPVVVAEYHIGKDQPLVRCSYCDQRQHHQHGFVVEFTPPSKHLVGSFCGPAKLDLHFTAAKRSHSELLTRQRLLQRLDALGQQRETIVAACQVVLFGEELKALEAKGQVLRKLAGDAVIRLHALARSGGHLTETIRVRDWEAERQRDEHREEGKKGGPIYRHETAPLGPLRGAAVLDAGTLRNRVHALKQALDGLTALTRGGTDQLTNTKLNKALSDIDRCHENASAAVAAINEAPSFFEPDHMRLLARWAQDAAKGALWEDNGVLYAGAAAIQPLPGWHVALPPPLV